MVVGVMGVVVEVCIGGVGRARLRRLEHWQGEKKLEGLLLVVAAIFPRANGEPDNICIFVVAIILIAIISVRPSVLSFV